MKQVLFITSYPLETEAAVRNRLTAYIKVGLALDYAITLISTDRAQYNLLSADNFHHIKVPERKQLGGNFIKRAFSESMRGYQVLVAARRTGIKDIVITIPSMFLLFESFLIKNRNLYLDVRDITWEYLSDQSLITRFAKRIFRKLAKIGSKHFELTMVTNHTEFEYAREQLRVRPQQILFVPNGVSQQQYDELTSAVKQKPETVAPSVTYIGNIGLAQNLTTLVDAAKNLPHIPFYVYGIGTDYERVINYKNELQVENITFFGRVSWENVLMAYKESSILYAQLSQDYAGAMPSKLYEYLCTGKYIIYGGDAQAVKVLSSFENYTIVPPDDHTALAAAISAAMQEKHYRRYSFKNSNQIKNKYIREKSTLQFYEKL